jgi:hypothetical protein
MFTLSHDSPQSLKKWLSTTQIRFIRCWIKLQFWSWAFIHAVPARALQLPSRIVLQPPSFIISNELPVKLQCCPLMGGPPWLPLHVQVLIQGEGQEKHKYDFVPREATSPETLLQLLMLQAVPGELRYFGPSGDSTSSEVSKLVQRAEDFKSRADPELHLIKNNCWTFAWKLLRHLDRNEAQTGG